ncbi:TrbI/VirB10 family protein [Piscirickettsia litoralis]|nr:TrbI/VirB10 family protein [Piscirickettsia litoralis]
MIIFIIILVVLVVLINNITEPKATDQNESSYVADPNARMNSKTTNYTNNVYDKMNTINEKNKIRQAVNQGKTVAEKSTQEINLQAYQESKLSTQDQRIAEITGSATYKKLAQRNNIQKNHVALNENKQQSNQQYSLQVSQKAQQMQSQIQGMVSDWDKVSLQANVVGKIPSITKLSNSQVDGKNGAGGSVIEKAGAILFAVLDTQLNSDQPGTPVMATIVQGKFKNAKLLGSFKREDEKLVVSFDHMSLPALDHSISIKAYAINATTAQNALASDVDNHYLLRYGGLFASAFLQGFGQYFSDTSNSLCDGSTTCIVTGDQSSSATEQTSQKAVYSGLGQVGATLGEKAASEFNRPPTVTLNQGVGMGILFMSDVKV